MALCPENASTPRFWERVLFTLFLYGFFFAAYLPANRLVSEERAHDLTTALDRAVPFVPEFVVPFYLLYLMLLVPPFLIRDRRRFFHAVRAFALLVAGSAILFFLFPVAVPRPEATPDTWAGALVRSIYAHDRPVCGFPSLHVSAALLMAILAARESRAWGTLFFAFFMLTAAATVMIRQHVVLDAAGGVAAALMAYGLTISHPVRLIRGLGLLIRSADEKRGAAPGTWEEHPGGVAFDFYPARKKSARIVLLVHGLTLEGARDPRLIRFARGIARSGLHAAALTLPGLSRFRFEPEDAAILGRAMRLLSSRSGQALAVAGFSVGGGMALAAAAENPETVDRMLLFGAHHDLAQTLNNLAGSGPADDEDAAVWMELVRLYRDQEALGLSMEQKEDLSRFLSSYCHGPDLDAKKAFLARMREGLPPSPAPDPAPDLAHAEALSPRGRLDRLPARVFLLHGTDDALVRPDESRKIFKELTSRGIPGGQGIVVTPLLSHVTRGSLGSLADAFRMVPGFAMLFDPPRPFSAKEDTHETG